MRDVRMSGLGRAARHVAARADDLLLPDPYWTGSRIDDVGRIQATMAHRICDKNGAGITVDVPPDYCPHCGGFGEQVRLSMPIFEQDDLSHG
jgi:hypothetical protein